MSKRFSTLAPNQYSAAQRQAVREFETARQGPIFGPFEPMLHSPGLMTAARAMGDHLRYRSHLPRQLSEFVILITAAEWSQNFEWQVHSAVAALEGLASEIIESLRQKIAPIGLNELQQACYDFSIELHRQKHVSDPVFERARALLGESGVIDLIGINGYYALLAMLLNTAQVEVPNPAFGETPPLQSGAATTQSAP